MQLLFAPTSPYARKVMVCAHLTGQAGRIAHLPTAAHPVRRDERIALHNPLAKVPTLITEDGQSLYDSRVICEYLASRAGNDHLFPVYGPARWTALTHQALGDGMLDASLLARYELTARPPATRSSHAASRCRPIAATSNPQKITSLPSSASSGACPASYAATVSEVLPGVPALAFAVAVALRTNPVGVCSTFSNTAATKSASSPAFDGVLTSGSVMETVPDEAPPRSAAMSFSNSTMWNELMEKNAVPAGDPLGEVEMLRNRRSPLGVPPMVSAFCRLMVPPAPVTRAVT